MNNLKYAPIGPFISLLGPLSWLNVAGSSVTRNDGLTTPFLSVVKGTVVDITSISANTAVWLFCLQPFTPTNQ